MKDRFTNLKKEKQEKIEAAALKEFATKTYEEASTNALVKSLGISKGSLFTYFSSKEELYGHVLNVALSKLLEHMAAYHYQGKKPQEELLSYGALEFDFLIANPNHYVFFLRMQDNLQKAWFQPFLAQLTKESKVLINRLYDPLGLSEDLQDHISLLMEAYNRRFVQAMTLEGDLSHYKSAYLKGLEKHLSLIEWSKT